MFGSTLQSFLGQGLAVLSIFGDLFSGELFNTYESVLGSGGPYEFI